jgi:hypothetical protein
VELAGGRRLVVQLAPARGRSASPTAKPAARDSSPWRAGYPGARNTMSHGIAPGHAPALNADLRVLQDVKAAARPPSGGASPPGEAAAARTAVAMHAGEPAARGVGPSASPKGGSAATRAPPPSADLRALQDAKAAAATAAPPPRRCAPRAAFRWRAMRPPWSTAHAMPRQRTARRVATAQTGVGRFPPPPACDACRTHTFISTLAAISSAASARWHRLRGARRGVQAHRPTSQPKTV